MYSNPLAGQEFTMNGSFFMSSVPKPSQQPKPQAKAAGAGTKVNKKTIIEDDDDDIGDDAEDYENFANVSTTALEHYGLAPHPSTVCEAATLSSVPSPEVNYSVKLPSEVLKSGAISALQFHAVRLACARHEQKLPDGSRAGFFLGDGPGVGKGRQIAATIFNYFCRGKTKALWVSVSTDLVVDARRDLEALGMLEYEAVNLHDLRQLRTKPGQPLSALPGLGSGIMFCTYDLLCSGATPAKSKTGKGAAANSTKAAVSKGFGLGGSSGFNSGSYGGLAVGSGGQRSASVGVWDDENIAPWERQHSPEEEEEKEQEREEFGPTSRLQQICEWLGDGDYVIVLDECHKAKNAMPKDQKKLDFPLDFGENTFEDKKKGKGNDGFANLTRNSSKTARAVIELQRRLPNARMMYVSATGASEAENLCYMERLGLWGPGSAFPTKQEFVGLLTQGGIGAMELVAMELKGAGCYLSRALSWADVRFETVAIDATEEFVSMYDAAVEVWQDTRDFLTKVESSQRKKVVGQFGAAQLRFFRQLCTAAKVDTVVKLCEDALAAGMCPVVGIQSTGEARTAEYVASMTKKNGEDTEFDSFVEPAALILSSFIQKNLMGYPGVQALLARATSLLLPKNPLDDLIDRLGGPGKVAEMTGRQKRMERAPGGGYKYVSRTAFYGGCSLDDVNILERSAFQQGRKKVAIISDAASAGISLHADKSAPNTAQRVQITLELAWSADKTVQQLGRTHRSNQVQPPIYKIVSTNICGEHRFASAVAHRLQQLGALTQGDRRAASASEALSSFNLQTKWAHNALKLLLSLIQSNGYSNNPTFAALTPAWLESLMHEGYPEGQEFPEPGASGYITRRQAAMDRWCRKAAVLFERVGLYGNNKTVTVHVLLNKLLGMKVEMQGQVFGYFSAILEKVVARAKKEGRFESTGIIKPGCEKITMTSTRTILQHRNGAAPTCLTIFATDRGVNWEKAKKLFDDEMRTQREQLGEAAAQKGYTGFFWSENAVGQRFTSLLLPKNERGTQTIGRGSNMYRRAIYYRVVRPDTGMSVYDVNIEDVRGKLSRITDIAVAQREWNRRYHNGMDRRLQPLNLITGSVLPLLKTITRVLEEQRTENRYVRRLQLMRIETTEDNMQRFIGVLVPDKVLSIMVAAIKGLEQKAPAQQEQHDKQGVSAAPTATAALVAGVKHAAAAAADSGAAAGSGAAGAAPSSLPAGLDPAVASLLSAASAAVQSSAELLKAQQDAAAAAAACNSGQQQQDDGDGKAGSDDEAVSSDGQEDGSSYSSEDEETAGRRQKHSAQRKKRRAPGRNRMTRAHAAAAADAAANSAAQAAQVNVVTEELLAAGLWEEGGADLTVRKGGAAAAGGGGTRWKKFQKAAAAGGASAGCKGGNGRGTGKRGRPSKKEWIVSDEEESSADDVESEEDADLSDADSGSSGAESEDDDSLGKSKTASKGRAATGRAAAKLASCKRAAAAAATAAMAAAAAAASEDYDDCAGGDTVTPAADDDDEIVMTEQPAAAAKPPAKKRGRRSKADSATAAEADAAIAEAAAAPPPAAAAQLVSVSLRGRVRKLKQLPDGYVLLDDAFPAAMPAAKAAVPSDGAEAAEVDTIELDAEQQHQQSEDEQATAAAAAAAADSEHDPAQPLVAAAGAADGEHDPAQPPVAAAPQPCETTAADVAAAAAAVDDFLQQQQQPMDDNPMETAAAVRSEEPQQQQQEQGSTPAASDAEANTADAMETEQPTCAVAEAVAATAPSEPAEVPPTAAGDSPTEHEDAAVDGEDDVHTSSQGDISAAAAAAAASEAKLSESFLRAIARVMLPGLSAAAGDSLSMKTVRLAVEAATKRTLDANMRAVLKKVCREYLEEQQQQEQQQQQHSQEDEQQEHETEAEDEEQHQGVSEAVVSKLVRKLLKKGGDACSSTKSTRLAAAARLGLTDLTGPHRSLVKRLVLQHLEQQLAEEEQHKQQISEEQEYAAEADDEHPRARLHTRNGRLASKRSSQHQQQDAELEDKSLEDPESPPPAAAAAPGSNSKRRRLSRTTPAAGTGAATATTAAVTALEVDMLDDDMAGLVDELMDDLQSPNEQQRVRLNPAAAATGAGRRSSSARDDSPVLPDVFEYSPSPRAAATGAAAAAAGSAEQTNKETTAAAQDPVVLSSWGARKRRSAWTAAPAGAATAAAAAKPQHRRAVIADSDDEAEDEQQQQQQPEHATTAAAATAAEDSSDSNACTAALSAEVASLQQQLAAANAQITELQLQRHHQQEAATAALAESEQLRAELARFKAQVEAAATAEAGAASFRSQAEQLRAELSTLKAQSEAASAAQAEAEKLRAASEQLRAELTALKQQTVTAVGYEQDIRGGGRGGGAAVAAVDATPVAAAAAVLSPAAVTPVHWAGLGRAASSDETQTAALADNCPTPRIGSALASIGSNSCSFDACKPEQQQQHRQQQGLAAPCTPGTAPVNADDSQQQQQQQSVPTLDAVRSWLEGHANGATAAQIIQAFASSNDGVGKGSEAGVAAVVAGYLQQLVDDIEVIRVGGAAAKSSKVDLADSETMYMALC